MTGKKNVLLINPLKNKLLEQYEMYPAGSLVLIGTMLHNSGHNVKIIHMLADGIRVPDLKNIIAAFNPHVVGITMNTFQTKCTGEISKVIKEADRNILVVAGGPHPSALKLRIFDDFPYIDVVVTGEGEFAFLEIVEGKDLREIKGIGCHNKMNDPRPLTGNLDHIPLPNLALVDFKKHRFVGVDPVGAYPTMYIMGARGCPFHCVFCNKSVWGDMVRLRKPELIIEEIKWIHEEYGVKEICFSDDTFNLNRKWAERIFNLIIDNKLNRKITYKASFRVSEKLVDKELLQLAKEAGFWLIFYGVENGNQEMLDRMKKGITIGEIKRAFELTHRAGLKTIGAFMFGLPGENEETIKDTFNLWKAIKPYITGYSPALPFPGTEFEKNVVEKGHLLTANYDEYSPEELVIRTDSLSKEDLRRYSRMIPSNLSIVRKMKHRITDWNYLKKIIIDSLRNPAAMFRRMRNLYNSLMSIVKEPVDIFLHR